MQAGIILSQKYGLAPAAKPLKRAGEKGVQQMQAPKELSIERNPHREDQRSSAETAGQSIRENLNFPTIDKTDRTPIYRLSARLPEEGRGEATPIIRTVYKTKLPSSTRPEEGKAVKRKKRIPDHQRKISKITPSQSLKL